jgi:hypothetical protein
MLINIDTEYISYITNSAYIFSAIFLIINDYYLFGLIGVLIWYISHKYHMDRKNKIWKYADGVVASTSFIYVLIHCNNYLLCGKNVSLFMLIFILFQMNLYYDKIGEEDIHNLIHSIWHITSAIFITYLIYNN